MNPPPARCTVSIMLALSACADSGSGPKPSTLEPSSAEHGATVAVTIRGQFPAVVQVSYVDRSGSSVDTNYTAELGTTALLAVEWQDGQTLTALVPASLPVGIYDLEVTDTLGRVGRVAGSFEVWAHQTTDGGVPDGGDPSPGDPSGDPLGDPLGDPPGDPAGGEDTGDGDSANGDGPAVTYLYKKVLAVDGAQIGDPCTGPLANYPLLVSIDADADLAAHVMHLRAYDLIFRGLDDLTCAPARPPCTLAHEVEEWNSGTLVAWVKLASLAHDADTTIEMRYGSAAVMAPTSRPSAVWTPYQAVWHLSENPELSANAFADSSSRANHLAGRGDLTATDRVDGQVGFGLDFDGLDDYLDRADADLTGTLPAHTSDAASEFTISAWVQLHAVAAANRNPIASKQGTQVAGAARGFMISATDAAGTHAEAEIWTSETDQTQLVSSRATPATWTHVAVAYRFTTDGSSGMRMFINGATVADSNTAFGPVQNNSQPLELGRYWWDDGYARYLDGRLDEVRISNQALPRCWHQTEFRNHTRPTKDAAPLDGFITVGPELPAD